MSGVLLPIRNLVQGAGRTNAMLQSFWGTKLTNVPDGGFLVNTANHEAGVNNYHTGFDVWTNPDNPPGSLRPDIETSGRYVMACRLRPLVGELQAWTFTSAYDTGTKTWTRGETVKSTLADGWNVIATSGLAYAGMPFAYRLYVPTSVYAPTPDTDILQVDTLCLVTSDQWALMRERNWPPFSGADMPIG